MPDPNPNLAGGPGPGAGAAAAPAPAPQAAPDKPKSSPSNWQRTVFPTCIIALILLGILYVGLWAGFPATRSWVLTLGLLVALFLYLGLLISERPLGILVNQRNLMSLSRFQMVAWTLVILSAFLTIAFRRILGHLDTALNMPMDSHLWSLLGISTASLVGTPLILQTKATQNADPGQIQSAAQTLNEDANEIDANRDGKLYANPEISDARITDMFQGDEIGNTAYVDMSKVQMFLFTIIIIVSYCSQIYGVLALFGQGQVKVADLQLPTLSAGVIALLGISHAGYLGSKTADHTPNSPN